MNSTSDLWPQPELLQKLRPAGTGWPPHVSPAEGQKTQNLSTANLRSHLLGVGPVPEDGVAVGHNLGAGLLAKYTHQHHQADEEDHFHLQHHYSQTSGAYFLFCVV